MLKWSSSNILIFLLIFGLHFILLGLTTNALFPAQLTPQSLFAFDLAGTPIIFPWWTPFIVNISNIFLLWLISKKIFTDRIRFIPPLVYAISPWVTYLTVANSIYVFLLCLILIFFLGYLIFNLHGKLGIVLMIGSSAILMFSSFFMFLIIPLGIGVILFNNLSSFTNLKPLIISTFIILLFLLGISFYNQQGFLNISKSQIQFLEDPALINSIQEFQGESKKEGYYFLSKLAENKYIYTAKYFVLKLSKQIAPSTIFTPQEKLLGFSFSSPIFVGFLPLFLFGLYKGLSDRVFRKYLPFALLLIFPSFMSKSLVDLNRLFLIFPFVILCINYGIANLQHKTRIVFVSLIIFLIFFQFIVTCFDIKLREYERFDKANLSLFSQIGKQ